MKRAQVRAAAICAAVLTVAGCGSGAESEGQLAIDGTFRQVLGLDVPSFHPYRDQVAAVYSTYLYDSLVNITPANEIVSGLADEWTSTPTSGEFTLRPGVTCSDGTPLRPVDVADALNYQRDPQRAPVAAAALAGIPDFTATADDAARTVTVTTQRPFSFVVRLLGTLPIVCPKGLADPEMLDKGSSGTGPYVLTEYTSGGPYVLDVRQGYHWGPRGARTDARGTPARIVLSVVSSPVTAANQLTVGAVDAFYTVDPDSVRAPGPDVTRISQPTVVGLASFNERIDRATSDPAVRTALLAALDPDQAAAVATGGRGEPARSLLFPGAFCRGDTVSGNRPGYDLAAAGRMLDQAGWVPGADGVRGREGRRLELKLVTFSTSPQLRSTAEFMAGEWKKIGAEVTIDAVAVIAFITVTQQGGDWDLSLGGGVVGSLPSDLMPFFSGAPPPQGRNAGAVDNPDYLSLTQQASAVPDEASCPLWQQAEAALIRRADTIVIAETTSAWFASRARFEVAANTTVIPTSIRMYG
ncbi:MAG: ABC transporter substrate-binding protein [Pseudonocardiaceae bacterium]